MGTARRLLEETLDRVEREAFGSHRWRWKIRLCIGLGRLWSLEQDPGKAMQFLDDGLRLALDTGSQKYVAEGRALRGELLMAGGRVAEGLHELQEGLALAETLPSPALTWRLAQSLGRAHEQRGNTTQALDTYTMALNAVMAAAGRIGDRERRERFLASPQAAVLRDDLGRLGRVGG
jgi:tetratricopeptide (TPR) repeat protein